MAKYIRSQKILRTNPNWAYYVKQEDQQIFEDRWWGGKTVTTYYNVEVRGHAVDAIDTDYIEFSRTLAKPLAGDSLEAFINEQHDDIRFKQTERDIDKIREEKRKLEQAELAERIRRETEERIRREQAERDRQMKEEQERDDIRRGQ